MKKPCLLIAGLFSISALAQESDTTYLATDTTYWAKGGLTSLTFTQVTLNNWAAGGNNSVSLGGYAFLFADYAKERITWKNSLEMGYGLIWQGRDGNIQKTDDKINAVTQFGYRLNERNLFWSSLIDFRTQFAEGFDEKNNRISESFAPAYVIITTGLEWDPSPAFSLTYSPVGGKFTFVLNQTLANAGAFGVDAAVTDKDTGLILREGKNSRAELGTFLKIALNKEIFTNVVLNSRLELFANYVEEFGNIDLNWQNLIVMKVNSFLTVNWQTHLLYDDDIVIEEFNDAGEVTGSGPKTQFKSVFGIGITYNFGATRSSQ